jgi:hypothetical protein
MATSMPFPVPVLASAPSAHGLCVMVSAPPMLSRRFRRVDGLQGPFRVHLQGTGSWRFRRRKPPANACVFQIPDGPVPDFAAYHLAAPFLQQ